MIIAFQFTFKNHLREHIASIAWQYLRNVVTSIQRAAMKKKLHQLCLIVQECNVERGVCLFYLFSCWFQKALLIIEGKMLTTLMFLCRWYNVIDPTLKLDRWTKDEDDKLLEAVSIHGFYWSKFSSCLEPDTDNQY